VSKHHYAIELAKRNNQVYFLNPPLHHFSCEPTSYENVFEINQKPFMKGLRFFPSIVQRWAMKKRFKALQRLASVKFHCIWSFDNSVFFDFSFLPGEVFTISHIVDFSQNFQFKKAAATADICLGVSQNIVDRLRRFNKNSFLIGHGMAVELGRKADIKLPGVNKIKAIYAGNLDSQYLDKKNLFELIRAHGEVDFIFLGPGGDDLIKCKNVFLLGRIDRQLLMNYLEKADVLLLLYDSRKFPSQLTNAHKILEYLESGKVVVSNFFQDYSDKPELLEMVKSQEEISTVFSRVISDLLFYNSKKKMEARRSFVQENTYGHRIMEIEKIVALTKRNLHNPKLKAI
jgi:hypothetical protein